MVSERSDSRASGLLLHLTSLPGRYGIGDLGPAAHDFAVRMDLAGQRYWQMLPVVPCGSGNSPYSSPSTFAGNPLLISPELLLEAALVDEEELASVEAVDEGRVDYETVHDNKLALLRAAARRFETRADATQLRGFADFKQREGPAWLDDYCLFAALQEVHDGQSWTDWEDGLSQREPGALEEASRALEEPVEANRVVQFLFFQQWRALRRTAQDHNVTLVGDLPLYVAHNSADVWANPSLFLLDDEGRPTVVAGVPPDYFSETGQRWGNPIFDWNGMASRDFAWWRARVRHALALFDVLRIDHFRGIAGYWEIPADEPTSVNGRWRPGPAGKLLEALRDELASVSPGLSQGMAGSRHHDDRAGLPIIAEDLGVITDDVIALRDGFGLPGMRVAQFGFDDAPDSAIHHPDQYPSHVWAYTGTHDNNTTKGWFWEDNPRHRVWRLKRPRRVLYRQVAGRIPWGLIEMVSRSRATASIFPVQDILELGAEARMNLPGTATGNWEWRFREGQLTDEALDRLHQLTREAGRDAG